MQNKLQLNQKELKELIKFCKDTKKGFIIFLHTNSKLKWEYITTAKEYILLTSNIPSIYNNTALIDINVILYAFNNHKIKEYIDII